MTDTDKAFEAEYKRIYERLPDYGSDRDIYNLEELRCFYENGVTYGRANPLIQPLDCVYIKPTKSVLELPFRYDLENCPNDVDILILRYKNIIEYGDNGELTYSYSVEYKLAKDNYIEWSKHYPRPAYEKIRSGMVKGFYVITKNIKDEN
jgi:hypothetical protein